MGIQASTGDLLGLGLELLSLLVALWDPFSGPQRLRWIERVNKGRASLESALRKRQRSAGSSGGAEVLPPTPAEMEAAVSSRWRAVVSGLLFVTGVVIQLLW